MKTSKQQALSVLLAIVLVFSALLAVDVLGSHMPKELEMMGAGFVLVILAIFIGLFWQESARDERETELIYHSSRMAYLAGLVVLGIGFAIQIIRHQPDTWLAFALVTMVLVKLLTRKP